MPTEETRRPSVTRYFPESIHVVNRSIASITPGRAALKSQRLLQPSSPSRSTPSLSVQQSFPAAATIPLPQCAFQRSLPSGRRSHIHTTHSSPRLLVSPHTADCPHTVVSLGYRTSTRSLLLPVSLHTADCPHAVVSLGYRRSNFCFPAFGQRFTFTRLSAFPFSAIPISFLARRFLPTLRPPTVHAQLAESVGANHSER
jgi:hypothetical protein